MECEWKISGVEITQVDGLVPIRMKLITTYGGVVTSGGWNFDDAAITLFSTAGFGRHAPWALRGMLRRRFSDRLDEKWLIDLIDGLKCQKAA